MANSNTVSKRRQDGKKNEKKTFSQHFWSEVRGYAEALIFAYIIVTFVFTTVGVVGSSMRPNLDGGSGQLPQALWQGDRVFIPKYDTWLRRMGILGEYQRGEVVVVREPANAPTALERPDRCFQRIVGLPCRPFFIKRVVGQPGDHIRVVEGQVYVNDIPVDQGFITDSGEITADPIDFPVVMVENGEVVAFQGIAQGTFQDTSAGNMPVPVDNPVVQLFYGNTLTSLAPIPDDAPEGEPFIHEIIVPEGHYYLMGDNRSPGGSEDSRYFGPVEAMTIAGRATAIIWPPMRDGTWNWRVLSPPDAFQAIPEPSEP